MPICSASRLPSIRGFAVVTPTSRSPPSPNASIVAGRDPTSKLVGITTASTAAPTPVDRAAAIPPSATAARNAASSASSSATSPGPSSVLARSGKTCRPSRSIACTAPSSCAESAATVVLRRIRASVTILRARAASPARGSTRATGAQSRIAASPASATGSPVGAKSRNPKPAPVASRSAPLTTRFAGVPITVQSPPSSVANESGISTSRGAIPALRASEKAKGSTRANAPMLFITVDTAAPSRQSPRRIRRGDPSRAPSRAPNTSTTRLLSSA